MTTAGASVLPETDTRSRLAPPRWIAMVPIAISPSHRACGRFFRQRGIGGPIWGVKTSVISS